MTTLALVSLLLALFVLVLFWPVRLELERIPPRLRGCPYPPARLWRGQERGFRLCPPR